MKRYVVGDIHGNYKALKQVLDISKFDYKKDFLIIIGDVVDGYDESYEVVEELIKIKNKIFIIGNHDVWFMNHIKNGWAEEIWLSQGGEATISSYNSHTYYYNKMNKRHIEFFNNGVYYYELDRMLFVHGGFNYPKLPKDSTIEEITWDRELIERMKSGLKIKEWKKIFVGHTTTENVGAVPITINFYEGKYAKLIKVDCGAGWNGRLCLFNIDTEEYFLSSFARELNPDSSVR